MDIKQLEGFVKLAETLNFSATAQYLYLSQPTLSHWIKQLEKELGLQLFKRTKQKVELTESGLSFYEDCCYLLEYLHKSIEKARFFSQKFNSQLVVAYENNTLASKYLSSIIKEFSTMCPETQIILKSTNFVQKDDLFLEQKADILFTVNDKITTVPNVVFEELYLGSYMCVLSPTHPLAKLNIITFKDLQREHLILLDPIYCPSEMKSMIKIICQNCPNSPISYADNQMTGCTLAKSGLGIAIMPDFVCVQDSELLQIPIQIEDQVPYGVVWKKTPTSKNTREFVTIAKKVYQENQLSSQQKKA